jgi:hypothetical protein
MSEEQTTQAVVDETNGAAQPAPAETSARTDDDLDRLLNEFDQGKPAPSEPAKPATAAPAADDQALATETVLNEAKFIRQQRFQQDMQATVKDVRGDLPSDLYDDDFVQAWIDAQATKDPRLANAWVNRSADPKKFGQVKAALGKEFAKRYGRIPDKQATEDREAVTAAVRGASTKAPEGKAPDYSRMTDSQLQAEKDRLFARAS